jgi:hypothetical protein
MTAYYTTPDTPGIVVVHDRRGWWHADLAVGTWTPARGSGELVPARPEEAERAEAIRPVNLGGRPEIGPAINVRLPKQLLGLVDDHAKAHDLTRAEAIRRLLDQALGVEVS